MPPKSPEIFDNLPVSESQKLANSITPQNTPEWQGYAEVCKQCGLGLPDARYSFSLHESYRRCNPSFRLADFRELAEFCPDISLVLACSKSFPYMRAGDIRILSRSSISLEKIAFIGGMLNELRQNRLASIPEIRPELVVLLQDTQTSAVRDYFQSYRIYADIRRRISFDTLLEVCSFGIPVSFLRECVERTDMGIPIFSETIRTLFFLGQGAPKIWEKFTKTKEQRFEHWTSSDYITLVRAHLTDDLYEKVCVYARDNSLKLSARECLRLGQAKNNPSIGSLQMYHAFFLNSSLPFSVNDIVECALCDIPIEKIKEYRRVEKEIDSGYSPDTWNIFDIIGMYRAGISPRESVSLWNRFSGDGPGKRFNCKREIRAELLAMPGFVALSDFLSQSRPILYVGKKIFELKNSDGNLGFIRGILSTLEQSKKGIPHSASEWQTIIQEYNNTLNEFIQEGELQEFSQIFFMTAQGRGEDQEGAFHDATLFRQTLEKRYGAEKVRNYSIGGTYQKIGTNRADDFIQSLEKYISDEKNKNKPILVHIGFHGDEDGNTGPFSREHMRKLLALASRPNVVLDIMSCFGGKKMDTMTQNLANVRLSSGLHAGKTSYDEIIEAFRPKSTLSFLNLRALSALSEKNISLLNQIDFHGQKLLYLGDMNSGILPTVTYDRKDIPEIKKIALSPGKTIGEDGELVHILEELLANSNGAHTGDFGENKQVSYSEAILYRQIHHRANLLPVTFATKNYTYKSL